MPTLWRKDWSISVLVYRPADLRREQALSPVGGRGIELMSEAIKLHNVTVRSFDGDLLVEGFINNEQSAD